MTRILCWFVHRWTDWATTQYGDLVWEQFKIGSYVTEQRSCTRCDKRETRTEETITCRPKITLTLTTRIEQRVELTAPPNNRA